MIVLNVYFCCELRFVATYAPNSDFYSEIQELTQILLRISEEKFGGWSLWSGQVSNEVLSFYILQYMFRLLSSIWEMCKNMYFAITWNSNTTEINWFDSDFAQTIWAKICWVGALLCTFIIFRSVHQRPAKCPTVSDQVSLSFAQFAKLQNQGCFITVEKDLIDLCHVMTSFYRPRPASELPKLQHLFNYRNCKNK